MKKIFAIIASIVVLLGFWAQTASAAVVENENFVYDNQGILGDFFTRDINIIAADAYAQSDVRSLLYIPEKADNRPIDLQKYANERLQSIGHGPYESVLIIAYSDYSLAVAYSNDLHPRNVKSDVEYAQGIIRSAANRKLIGVQIMEAYHHLVINVGLSQKHYEVKDPLRDLRYFRDKMLKYSIICIAVVVLIWNVILRWSEIVKTIVFLVCEALMVIASIMMVLSNQSARAAGIILAALTVANIFVVFSNYIGLIAIIRSAIAKKLGWE